MRILNFATPFLLMLLFACGGSKISQEMQQSMLAFETEWKATGADIAAWGNDMDTSFMAMEQQMNTAMQLTSSSGNAAAAAAIDSLHSVCISIGERMKMIRSSYDRTSTGFHQDDKAYLTWKKMLMDGEISETEAQPALNDFNVKMKSYRDNMTGWMQLTDQLQERCDISCRQIELLSQQ